MLKGILEELKEESGTDQGSVGTQGVGPVVTRGEGLVATRERGPVVIRGVNPVDTREGNHVVTREGSPLGVMAVAVITHYFSPGSLRLNTDSQILSLENFDSIFGEEVIQLGNTRKWLQKNEAPYPGYCRAPGNSRCLPKLCNCDKLRSIWTAMEEKKALKRTIS